MEEHDKAPQGMRWADTLFYDVEIGKFYYKRILLPEDVESYDGDECIE